ncbi:CaiB/BaiF CoA transferase family protein [Paraburkholderia aromaticivorans]|uniref:CaiB/BaiF CoA transferase family protein n=1 Tax=Paraburkholderia aromaticivorans TaxID=2026199 RepID=UPI001455F343|nr:CaiB/BaiF CoA-transferase family protein [Paraburkholderia aromaticivorans]
MEKDKTGPLAGVKVVELGGIGPGPFGSMILSDMGAEVLRIDRIVASDSGVPMDDRFNLLNRGRRSVAMDLKKPESVTLVKRLLGQADAVIEGFRPGVAERLGLGPDDCLAANPALVYGRMTGWGQEGPLSQAPGHDLNYIALTGALHSIGTRNGPPVPPLNLVGDFGGGGLYLAFGIVCAILEARQSGKGQVVDAAMVDGASSLMTLIYGMRAAGAWTDERGTNRLDSGAPWYNVYETKDGRYIALASNEPRFYKVTLELLGLDGETLPGQHDRDGWPTLHNRFAEVFRQRTRDEWCALAEGAETCLSPVLSLAEAPLHPHNRARGTFVEVDGVVQPAPAPRFSRTKATIQRGPAAVGEHTDEALTDWGLSASELAALRTAEAIM